MPRGHKDYVVMMFSDTREHIEDVFLRRELRLFHLDRVRADFRERTQHPLPSLFRYIEDGDRVRRLGEHPGEQSAHLVGLRRGHSGDVRLSAERTTDHHVPGHAGIERRSYSDIEDPIRHRRARLRNRIPIAVDAADDVAVVVEWEKKGAVAAVDFEDAGTGTDVKRFGDIFGKGEKRHPLTVHYLLSAAKSSVAVSIATETTLVPAGTRNGNEHLYSGSEPGSMIATEVL